MLINCAKAERDRLPDINLKISLAIDELRVPDKGHQDDF